MTAVKAVPRWLRLARQDIGTREISGPRHEAKILVYSRDIGQNWVDNDEVAWCAAFLGSCLERSGIASTRSLRARSYQTWGQHLKKPRPGCIAVLSRGANPALGHLGFFIRETEDNVVLLGGNQSNAVNQRQFAKSRVLSWRWPTPGDIAAMAPQTASFEDALAHVLEFEGQYSDHPADPGGPTFQGVTIGRLAGHLGLRAGNANRSLLIAGLKALDERQVRTIYWQHYWLAASANKMPDGLGLMLFDAAVQHGPGRAIKMLQRIVGVEADGEVGPLTLAGVRAAFIPDVVREFGQVRRAFYHSLRTFRQFGRGWMRRLDKTIKRALEAAPTTQPDKTKTRPQPQKPKDFIPMKNQQKWWMESLTIWGTLITALSTVLPIIGPFVGLDLSAAVIEQFGEAVARLIQALGGITGTFMAVYGRMRATTALTQRLVKLKV